MKGYSSREIHMLAILIKENQKNLEQLVSCTHHLAHENKILLQMILCGFECRIASRRTIQAEEMARLLQREHLGLEIWHRVSECMWHTKWQIASLQKLRYSSVQQAKYGSAGDWNNRPMRSSGKARDCLSETSCMGQRRGGLPSIKNTWALAYLGWGPEKSRIIRSTFWFVDIKRYMASKPGELSRLSVITSISRSWGRFHRNEYKDIERQNIRVTFSSRISNSFKTELRIRWACSSTTRIFHREGGFTERMASRNSGKHYYPQFAISCTAYLSEPGLSARSWLGVRC